MRPHRPALLVSLAAALALQACSSCEDSTATIPADEHPPAAGDGGADPGTDASTVPDAGVEPDAADHADGRIDPDNQPPVFLSEPATTTAVTGGTWVYGVEVEDPDGDPVGLELLAGPEGLGLGDGSTALFWVVGGDQAGQHPVKLQASDGRGGTALQEFVVTVTHNNRPPRITSQAPVTGEVGQEYAYQATAVDPDGDPLAWSLVEGPPGMAIGADGLVTLSPAEGGVHRATIQVADPEGASARERFSVSVATGQDDQPPEVALSAPAEGAEVDTPVDVSGTAEDPHLGGYSLELCQPVGEAECAELARGFEPVEDGVLGTLDPGRFEPGRARLRLSAWDADGNTAAATRDVELGRVPQMGLVVLQFTDLVTRGGLVELELSRVYDSRRRDTSGDFGQGWSLELSRARLDVPRPVARAFRYSGGGLERSLEPDEDNPIEISLPDGRRYAFLFAPHIANPLGDLVEPHWLALQPNTSIQPLDDNGWLYEVEDLVLQGGELVEVMRDFRAYNPPAYRLTTEFGEVFDISVRHGPIGFADAGGSAFRIAPDGIHGADGPVISYERDDAGRITRVVDPVFGQELTYEYGPTGDLVGVTHDNGEQSRFSYDADHYLLSYRLPDGLGGSQYQYDEQGRVVAAVQADGTVTLTEYDDDARTVTVTDATGASVVTEYDERRNVVAVTDPLGNRTSMEHDEEGRLVRRTDPEGGVTLFAYDARGNQTELVDPLGNTWRDTYDAQDQLVSTTDADGRTLSYEHEDGGPLVRLLGPGGQVLRSWTWTDEGQVATETNGAGRTVRYTYEGGRLAGVDSGDGDVLQMRYEDGGLVQHVTDAQGLTTWTRVDTGGRFLGAGTPSGETVAYAYDLGGQLRSVAAPDGRRVELARNPAGQVAAVVVDGVEHSRTQLDAAGRVSVTRRADGSFTRYRYDAAGNVTELETPAGTTAYAYDRNGRLVGITRPDGRVVRLERDLAGRITALEDALDRRWALELAPSGRITAVTDPGGRQRRLEYDDGGLLAGMSGPGCGGEQVVHDLRFLEPEADWLPLAERTTATGRRWSYDNDARGRPVAVTDPAGQRTEYAWNERDDLVRITDAAGGQWTFSYVDGRLSETESPAGHVRRFLHDEEGGMETEVRPDGSEVTWTAAEGEVTRRFSGGLELSLHADDLGRMVETHAPGADVSTVYDDRGRPVEVRYGDGAGVRYSWDEGGRVEAIEAATPDGSAARVEYEWDEAGRMAAMTDPAGRRTTYTWDVDDRLTRLERPNGTETAIEYGDGQRPTEIVHRDAAGDVWQRWSFEYDAECRLVAEDGPEGSLAYRYDEGGRLAAVDRLDGPGGAVTATTTYAWDAVGNRTRVEGRQGATVSTYDADGRLLESDGPGGRTQATWDGRGNLTSLVGPEGETRYGYDAADRLEEATLPDGSRQTWSYDAQGRVVAEGGRRCLAAPHTVGPLSHCLATYGDGAPRFFFFDALGIAGDHGAEGTRYAHRAALGSVVGLSDGAGASLGGYRYDPFGRRLASDGPGDFRFGFAGEHQEAGLVFLRSRWYAPALGAFLTPDGAPADAGDPATLARYVYVQGDPLNAVDPLGTVTVSLAGLSVSVTIQNVLSAVRAVALRCLKKRLVRRLIMGLAIGAFSYLAGKAIGDALLGFAKKFTGAFLEKDLNRHLRDLVFCAKSPGAMIAFLGAQFEVPIDSCGDAGGGVTKCSQFGANLPKGTKGVDVLLGGGNNGMGGFPIELKRAGGAFNKTQLDYFCRYASRSKLLLTYIYGSLPSRDKFGKQLVDCLGCWTEAPPCVGKRKPWGGVLLWLGLDNNKKPRAYLPSPKGLCG